MPHTATYADEYPNLCRLSNRAPESFDNALIKYVRAAGYDRGNDTLYECEEYLRNAPTGFMDLIEALRTHAQGAETTLTVTIETPQGGEVTLPLASDTDAALTAAALQAGWTVGDLWPNFTLREDGYEIGGGGGPNSGYVGVPLD